MPNEARFDIEVKQKDGKVPPENRFEVKATDQDGKIHYGKEIVVRTQDLPSDARITTVDFDPEKIAAGAVIIGITVITHNPTTQVCIHLSNGQRIYV